MGLLDNGMVQSLSQQRKHTYWLPLVGLAVILAIVSGIVLMPNSLKVRHAFVPSTRGPETGCLPMGSDLVQM